MAAARKERGESTKIWRNVSAFGAKTQSPNRLRLDLILKCRVAMTFGKCHPFLLLRSAAIEQVKLRRLKSAERMLFASTRKSPFQIPVPSLLRLLHLVLSSTFASARDGRSWESRTSHANRAGARASIAREASVTICAGVTRLSIITGFHSGFMRAIC